MSLEYSYTKGQIIPVCHLIIHKLNSKHMVQDFSLFSLLWLSKNEKESPLSAGEEAENKVERTLTNHS